MKAQTEALYLKIYNDIKEDIESNVLMEGDRIPTELELTLKYGVSRITATRAVKELEKDFLVHRIRKRGTIVNSPSYRSSLAGNSKRVIPIILPFSESMGFSILDGAQHEAKLNNCMISVYNTEHIEEKEIEILNMVYDFDVLGLLIYPTTSKKALSIYSKFILNNIPIVALDRTIDFLDIPCVASDNFTSSYDITRYLLSKGHTKIGFYCEAISMWESSIHTRFKGYCEALLESRLTIRDDYIFETIPHGLDYDASSEDVKSRYDREQYCVEAVLDDLGKLEDPPTAIIFINDLSACAFMKYAIRRGIRIPDDISIVGFDNLSICDHVEVPLTSCEQNFYSMGRTAMKLIFSQLSKVKVNPNYLLSTKIIERKSVKDISIGETK